LDFTLCPFQSSVSSAGFTKVAGGELTLLDCVRYFHQASGIDRVAQIVKDIGAKAVPRKLAKIARLYENSAVRRLGYLLNLAAILGSRRRWSRLRPRRNRSSRSIRPIQETSPEDAEKNMK
jgi:predicted transcriptional regulator of viral defense system